METVDTPLTIMQRALQLIDDATAAGVVIPIRTEPMRPLAMGHYQMVASVRAGAASYRVKEVCAVPLPKFVPLVTLSNEQRAKIENDMMTVDSARTRRYITGQIKT